MNSMYLLDIFQNSKYQDKIFSQLIKTKRKEKKISSKKLSLSLHVSQQYISDIEERRKRPSKELLDHIFHALDITFNYDFQIVKNTETIFEQFIEQFLLNDKNQFNTIQSIVNNDEYRYSYAYSLVLICDYIYNYLNLKNNQIDFDEEKLFKNIVFLLNDMDPLHKSILYLFRGRFYYYKNDIDKATTNYLIALEHASTYSSELIDGIKGAIYHNYAFLLARENKLHEAEDQMNKAIGYLKSLNYLNRTIHAENTLSLIYMNQHQYKKAEIQLYRTLRLVNQTKETKYYSLIYSNIATLSFERKEYEKCIEDSLKALEYDKDFNDLYYYLSISYYKIGDIENCRKYYNVMNELDLSNDKFCNLYKGLIALYLENAKKSVIFKYLRDFYTYTTKHEIISNQIDILNLLIDFCRENEKYKYLSKYQQILLDHYKNT